MKLEIKKQLIAEGYLPISLLFTSTFHPQVKAMINHLEGLFIVDTGASNTCVGVEFAEYFHLTKSKSEVKASGAGATGMDTYVSVGKTLQIGKWIENDVPLVLFDLSHVNQALIAYNCQPVHGIIGADILRKHKGIISYLHKTLFLKKPKNQKK